MYRQILRKYSTLFRIGFSILVVIFVLYHIDDEKVVNLLLSVDVKWVGYLLVLITLDRFLMAYKWSILLEAKGLSIPLLSLVKLYYVGTFVGVFLPTTVGGDLLRVYLLSDKVGKAEDILSSVVVERLSGFLAALVLAFVSISIFEYMYVSYHASLFYLVLIFTVVFSTLIFLSLRKGVVDKVFEFVPKSIQKTKIFDKLRGVYLSYIGYSEKKTVLLKFLGLSLLEHLFPIAEYYVSARAVGVVAPIMVFFAVVPMVMLIIRIPVSFNGIGVNEGLLVYFFSLLGLSTAGAFSIGLLGHVGILLACVPGFVFYIWDKKSIPAEEG